MDLLSDGKGLIVLVTILNLFLPEGRMCGVCVCVCMPAHVYVSALVLFVNEAEKLENHLNSLASRHQQMKDCIH